MTADGMKIYGGKLSPFVQRALMAARAKGHEIEVVPPPGGMQSAEFLAISPMGRVPLLELDDGTRLSESGAIAAYLDEAVDGRALLPSDAVGRARVREIEAVAGLEFATGIRPIMVHRVFGRPDPGGAVDAAQIQAGKGADALDTLLNGAATFAVGPAMTLADCLLVPVFTLAIVIDGLAGTGALVNGRHNLAAYYRRMTAEPIAARSIDEMTRGFATMAAARAAAASAN